MLVMSTCRYCLSYKSLFKKKIISNPVLDRMDIQAVYSKDSKLHCSKCMLHVVIVNAFRGRVILSGTLMVL